MDLVLASAVAHADQPRLPWTRTKLSAYHLQAAIATNLRDLPAAFASTDESVERMPRKCLRINAEARPQSECL